MYKPVEDEKRSQRSSIPHRTKTFDGFHTLGIVVIAWSSPVALAVGGKRSGHSYRLQSLSHSPFFIHTSLRKSLLWLCLWPLRSGPSWVPAMPCHVRILYNTFSLAYAYVCVTLHTCTRERVKSVYSSKCLSFLTISK